MIESLSCVIMDNYTVELVWVATDQKTCDQCLLYAILVMQCCMELQFSLTERGYTIMLVWPSN